MAKSEGRHLWTPASVPGPCQSMRHPWWHPLLPGAVEQTGPSSTAIYPSSDVVGARVHGGLADANTGGATVAL